MKILVVSDSHGDRQALQQLREKYQQETVAMFHCGDSELDSNDPLLADFIYVKGNCDYGQAFVDEQVKDIAGLRFFITHGHLYNIKMTLQNLSYKAEEVQANIVLFGHSHSAGSMLGSDGVLYLNPGSILLPRGRVEKTYVILDIDGKEVSVHFYDHEGTRLDKLSASYQLN